MRFVCISDTHIGSVFAKQELLSKFLEANRGWDIFLLGDIVDTWKGLPDDVFYADFLGKSVVRYFPGNHDEELIAAKIFYPGVMKKSIMPINNKRILFTHGDLFDESYGKDSFFNRFSEGLLYRISKLLNIDLRSKLRKLTDYFYYNLSSYYKRTHESMINLDVDYLIYGHTHCPGIKVIGTKTMINLGSWYDDPKALFVYGDKYAFISISEDNLQPQEKDFNSSW